MEKVQFSTNGPQFSVPMLDNGSENVKIPKTSADQHVIFRESEARGISGEFCHAQ
jgi:hypothetical protein